MQPQNLEGLILLSKQHLLTVAVNCSEWQSSSSGAKAGLGDVIENARRKPRTSYLLEEPCGSELFATS